MVKIKHAKDTRTDKHDLLYKYVVAFNKPDRVIRCVSEVIRTTSSYCRFRRIFLNVNRQTYGRTYGQTQLLIEMRSRIYKDKIKEEAEKEMRS